MACFFKYRTDHITRVHGRALTKERCKLDIRKYVFSQRTINEWNRMSKECVNATSVNMLKNKIDNYFKRYRVCLDLGYEYNRTLESHWLPCHAQLLVPNIIRTWGENSVKSVKFSHLYAAFEILSDRMPEMVNFVIALENMKMYQSYSLSIY